jgi:LysR family transcriptional activator of glutamate synthase operon
MDTDALRWFQQVADGVTVTEVSQMEPTTQPGVSRALARLEAEVGTPLLHRSGRVLRMTHAGAAFKRHVDVMIHALDDGIAAVSQLLDPATGTVTLAFQPSLGTWLVPHLLGGFRSEHPGVRFDLRPKRDEFVAFVGERMGVDLELSTVRSNDPAIEWTRLTREPLKLAVPHGHPLARRRRVSLRDVRDESFITISPSSALHDQTDALCRQAGFVPKGTFEGHDLATLYGFVGAGLGLAIVPAMRGGLAEAALASVRLVDIIDASASREIGLAWATPRRLLPAADSFRGYVLAQAAAGALLEDQAPDTIDVSRT